jgi:hypothetical protein
MTRHGYSRSPDLPWPLQFFDRWWPSAGFVAGNNAHALLLPGARFAVSICYESLWPGFFRSAVIDGQVPRQLTTTSGSTTPADPGVICKQRSCAQWRSAGSCARPTLGKRCHRSSGKIVSFRFIHNDNHLQTHWAPTEQTFYLRWGIGLSSPAAEALASIQFASLWLRPTQEE